VKVARLRDGRQKSAAKDFAVMNPPETQSDCNSETQYFDPEQPDSSEQEFAVSLEEKLAPPRFVVESADQPIASVGLAIEETKLQLSEVDAAISASENAAAESDTVISTSGDSAAEIVISSAGQSANEKATSEATSEPDWRDLVSAKVSSYKSRRPRKERYPSLQLKFDANHHRQKPEAEDFGFASSYVKTEQPQHSERLSAARNSGPPLMFEATARVLEFPRSSASFAISDELAEPVLDRPRIVEAPELVPPPPAMGGILMEAPREPEPERRAGFDMPLQSAAPKRRVLAGACDGLVVGAAVAVFGYVALRVIGSPLPWRAQTEIVAGLIAVFWPAYQYAFLVFCGKTPGLRVAGLRLQRFDGGSTSRSLRQWRVLASVLSAASLGLGYLWCFLDEDQLSWHDRITRTHLAPCD
jgi:uncharacterized RDD family membrane protein YckC